MEQILIGVLNMSVTASLVALAVMILPLPLKKAPRWISYALWAVVLIRLVCPVSFSASASLPGGVGATVTESGTLEYLSLEANEAEVQPTAESITTAAQTDGTATHAATAATRESGHSPAQIWLKVAAVLWVAGAAGMLLNAVVSYAKLKRRIADAVPAESGVCETDEIGTPFVCGLFKPRIYLPSGLEPGERRYILLHERAHIERGDHWMKLIAFLALSVHWFNPVIWLSFRLMSRDMEISCDERAIRSLDRDEKADYGETLFLLGCSRMVFAGSPLAFGENCTKSRIMNILNYRKPAFWIVLTAILAAAAAAVLLLANPWPGKNSVTPVQDVEIEGYVFRVEAEKPYQKTIEGNADGKAYFDLDTSLFESEDESLNDMIEAFLGRLTNGQLYIQAYLAANAAGMYDETLLDRSVHYTVRDDGVYAYTTNHDYITVRVGKSYWHCAEEYLYALMRPSSLHWQHYGYAYYLGSMINPYDEIRAIMGETGVQTTEAYGDNYAAHGGNMTEISNDDYRMLADTIAYQCLTDGMHWGTQYESYPVGELSTFGGLMDTGDDMSVMMAASFTAWLAEHYGFDKLSGYCFGKTDFEQAFGRSFDKVYGKWQDWILSTYAS